MILFWDDDPASWRAARSQIDRWEAAGLIGRTAARQLGEVVDRWWGQKKNRLEV